MQRSKNFVAREIRGVIFFISITSLEIYVLSEIGAFIWNHVDECLDEDILILNTIEKFGLHKTEQVKASLKDYIIKMTRLNIIV